MVNRNPQFRPYKATDTEELAQLLRASFEADEVDTL